jgi:hypothetical protein
LWTKEGGLTESHREAVAVQEAFDLKLHLVKQLNENRTTSPRILP